ncbi:hypothetical protein Pmar_PMAR014360 [Perkinsus marinus ATCC 50983]|uniref:Uncharacterized protein n=2 Tax=Perkinsus marinus (strain ATCC 50983 / TXsc) TaxID=423536 RepID=C5KL33_PERM5|nr:hypothetical protein Pmar_PMAR014360 [Perkinsus marinus ATCC 50983]EER14810.1 hypothetical protein Pmar_PMAR014360 [Perkinsus marinus ATCC 50983]|eukprot:XP_002783014.1 hypothetical protein Pmar_PMAR014360 [Perkinsus marinus ATCC 50983]
MTPRLWANVCPAELHFVYGTRVPGERGSLDGEVNWEVLKLKYLDTDLVQFVQDNIPVLEGARDQARVTLSEYLELWRMKQSKYLERLNQDKDRRYTPALFDVVFMSKGSDLVIGNHLDTRWYGPGTVTSLKGSALVGVTPGIVIPGLGGVAADAQGSAAEVPEVYGVEESFPLRNLKHAGALQKLIYDHLLKGKRVYCEADGTLKWFEYSEEQRRLDGERVRQLRTRAAGKKEREGSPEEGCDLERSIDIPKVKDEGLRKELGVSEVFKLGHFMTVHPPKGSFVVSTAIPYVGLAQVLGEKESSEDCIKLQPMTVVHRDHGLVVAPVRDKGVFTTTLDKLVYVKPEGSMWTRRRCEDLEELLKVVLSRVTL